MSGWTGEALTDNPTTDYEGGTSQHPTSTFSKGLALIERVYRALRGSNLWDESLLVITYDEHGGFYDHVAQLPMDPVNYCPSFPYGNIYGRRSFDFSMLGLRVPALLISPWTRVGMVDHDVHEHSVLCRTAKEQFRVTNFQSGRLDGTPTFSDQLFMTNPQDPAIIARQARMDALYTVAAPVAQAQISASLASAAQAAVQNYPAGVAPMPASDTLTTRALNAMLINYKTQLQQAQSTNTTPPDPQAAYQEYQDAAQNPHDLLKFVAAKEDDYRRMQGMTVV